MSQFIFIADLYYLINNFQCDFMYVPRHALYKVDWSTAIKFRDYAMVVAGSTVRRGWRYLLSPFNLRDLRNRHGRLQEQSEKQTWQITITETNVLWNAIVYCFLISSVSTRQSGQFFG